MSKLPKNENDVRQRRESWIKKWSYFQTHYYDDIKSIKNYYERDIIEPERHLNGYIGKGINPFVSFRNGVFSFDKIGLKRAFDMINVDSPSLHIVVKSPVRPPMARKDCRSAGSRPPWRPPTKPFWPNMGTV